MRIARFAEFSRINESTERQAFDAEGAERYFAGINDCPDCIPTNARGWQKIKNQINRLNELSDMDEQDAKMVIQNFNKEAQISDDISWYNTIMAYILDGGDYKQSI